MPLSGGYYYPGVQTQTSTSTASSAAATSLSGSGSAVIGGNASIGGTLSVAGASTLAAVTASNASITGPFAVTGRSNLATLTSSANIYLSSAGALVSVGTGTLDAAGTILFGDGTTGGVMIQKWGAGPAVRILAGNGAPGGYGNFAVGTTFFQNTGKGAVQNAGGMTLASTPGTAGIYWTSALSNGTPDVGIERLTTGSLVITNGSSTGSGSLLVGSGTMPMFTASATASLMVGERGTGFALPASGALGVVVNMTSAFRISTSGISTVFTNNINDSYSAGFTFQAGRFGGYTVATLNYGGGFISIGGIAAANALNSTGVTVAPPGAFTWQGNNVNGGFGRVSNTTQLASAMNGATVSLAAAIPAGSVVLGVATRVTTLIGGATSFSIGDGTNATAFGANIAVAAGTTTNNTNWTITSVPIYPAATAIVLTANGSNFTAGAVRVDVYYALCGASTS